MSPDQREKIVRFLTARFADRISHDHDYLYDVATKGHEGFRNMSGDELKEEYRIALGLPAPSAD